MVQLKAEVSPSIWFLLYNVYVVLYLRAGCYCPSTVITGLWKLHKGSTGCFSVVVHTEVDTVWYCALNAEDIKCALHICFGFKPLVDMMDMSRGWVLLHPPDSADESGILNRDLQYMYYVCTTGASC